MMRALIACLLLAAITGAGKTFCWWNLARVYCFPRIATVIVFTFTIYTFSELHLCWRQYICFRQWRCWRTMDRTQLSAPLDTLLALVFTLQRPCRHALDQSPPLSQIWPPPQLNGRRAGLPTHAILPTAWNVCPPRWQEEIAPQQAKEFEPRKWGLSQHLLTPSDWLQAGVITAISCLTPQPMAQTHLLALLPSWHPLPPLRLALKSPSLLPGM